jgi:hypothetical protein
MNRVKPEVKAFQERFKKTAEEKQQLKRLKAEHKKLVLLSKASKNEK